MKTTKNVSEKKNALISKAKKSVSYNAKSALAFASVNGASAGRTTAKNGGEKVINSGRKQGAPIALSTIIRENFPKAETVSAEKLLPIFAKAFNGPENIRISGIVSKATGTPFGNLGTLLRRETKAIEAGVLLRYKVV